MLKLAAQYYEYVLWSTPAGEPGRKLLESRKVSEETARRFQLGYAPAGRGFADPGWDVKGFSGTVEKMLPDMLPGARLDNHGKIKRKQV